MSAWRKLLSRGGAVSSKCSWFFPATHPGTPVPGLGVGSLAAWPMLPAFSSGALGTS